MKKINIFVVPEQSGSAVGLGIYRPIASRTNTDAGERQATDPTGMDERFTFVVKPILIPQLSTQNLINGQNSKIL